MTLLSSFPVSIYSFVNPTQRWHRLRGCCCSLLESNIWRYRAHRVGDYKTSEVYPNASQDSLQKSCKPGGRRVTGADGDLATTAAMEKGLAEPYKHCQYSGNTSNSASREPSSSTSLACHCMRCLAWRFRH